MHSATHNIMLGLKQIIDSLDSQPMKSLSAIDNHLSSGVYLLYYTGNHPSYQGLVKYNQNRAKPIPIYVGVAGGRRSGVREDKKQALTNRLTEHSKSIAVVNNLDLQDFQYQYLELIGDAAHLVGAFESILIEQHQPLWNSIITGFGNKNPGSNRTQGNKSNWDVLHPGRVWAENRQVQLYQAATVNYYICQHIKTLKD